MKQNIFAHLSTCQRDLLTIPAQVILAAVLLVWQEHQVVQVVFFWTFPDSVLRLALGVFWQHAGSLLW